MFIRDSQYDFHAYIDCAVVLQDTSLSSYYKALLSDINIQLVYSDHDSLDSFSRQEIPVFKPEWNRELLHNTNYIGGLVMLRNGKQVSSCNWNSELENSSLYLMML